ncbi:hypothetical protein ABZ379_05740 [Streptomyces canus]|uniref:hypothetical protein n=1 Tax=Streptomyces canus TaxID=58343 RepID=UPI00340B3B8C
MQSLEQHAVPHRRFLLVEVLLPALAGFEVIAVDEDASNHHVRGLAFDGNLLSDVRAHAMSA